MKTKEKLMRSKFSMLLIAITLGLLVSGVSFILIEAIQRVLFVPDDYLMFQFKDPYCYIVFIYEIEIVVISMIIMRRKFLKTEIKGRLGKLIKWLKRYRACIISLNIILFYMCVTGVSVVTENYIRDYSFYNPMGKQYSYDDIETVNTGFKGSEDKGIIGTKGTFYYIVTFNDGVSIDYSYASSDLDKYDTYEEVEKLDNLIMNEGRAEKISSARNVQYNDYDDVYQKRFLEIIYNGIK